MTACHSKAMCNLQPRKNYAALIEHASHEYSNTSGGHPIEETGVY